MTVLIAVIIDAILGEPKKYHPLIAFGKASKKLEGLFNRAHFSASTLFILGAVAWTALIIPIALILTLLQSLDPSVGIFLDIFVVYLCIAHKSLKQHLRAVLTALQKNALHCAKQKVALIVSRETQAMSATEVRKASIESCLENGADGTFCALFWFFILGAPGIIVYRLANTLDAMWGYKTRRFLYFGKFAAYADDVLNWIPARLVALSYALLGNSRVAIRAWKTQAKHCLSPNGGVVMCAGAGALELSLGGKAVYHGRALTKATMGYGHSPENQDIEKAIRLIDRTLLLWCFIACIIWFL